MLCTSLYSLHFHFVPQCTTQTDPAKFGSITLGDGIFAPMGRGRKLPLDANSVSHVLATERSSSLRKKVRGLAKGGQLRLLHAHSVNNMLATERSSSFCKKVRCMGRREEGRTARC